MFSYKLGDFIMPNLVNYCLKMYVVGKIKKSFIWTQNWSHFSKLFAFDLWRFLNKIEWFLSAIN